VAIGDISDGSVLCGQNTDKPNCSAVQCKGYRSVALDSVNSVFGSKTDKNTEELVRSLFVDGQGDAATMNKPDAVAAFERVQAQLKARLGSEVHSSWFGRLKLAETSKSIVRLTVPTPFLRAWISNHYMDLISELWRIEFPDLLKVEIVVRTATRAGMDTPTTIDMDATRPAKTIAAPQALSKDRKPAALNSGAEALRDPAVGSALDPRYTFANFVEGSSNRVAHAAARTVAESGTGAVRFNPLFIHASVGLGKTHLLQAIATEAVQRNPKARVVYLTAEYFMWRFATAIRDNSALSFKEQLRDIDLLIIDDMQFLQGKAIQNEFCHLVNMLIDSARQVVVAADRPPSELESLDPRVRSRLQGGVALEVGAPDYAMRLDILKRRLAAAQAEDASLNIPDNILDHVAKTVTGSGRDLEGAFNQLLFRQTFEPDMTVERVEEYLGHLIRNGEPKRVRVEDIQRVVSRHYNVPRSDLLSNRRTRIIVRPRQVAMYLAKMMTPRSLPEIGRRFGGRDHTTVLHAVRKIEGQMGTDAKLSQEMELLKRLIQEQM
jgi:chromosomal replication initiator protein